jgi:hypothetical protein
VVLGSELDLARRLESLRDLRLFCRLDLFLFLLLVFVAPVEPDRRFQHEEHVVARSLDFADRLRDPVGLGKGIVDRVSQFLHEVLQWLFHRDSLIVDAPR